VEPIRSFYQGDAGKPWRKEHLEVAFRYSVTSLDRLARSARALLDIAERPQAIGAGLRSLSEPWADTTGQVVKMGLTALPTSPSSMVR
jgi:hypothetical protein